MRCTSDSLNIFFVQVHFSICLSTFLALHTKSILSKQNKHGLKKIKKKSNIFVAYEPVWSIGTGKIPKINELEQTVEFIKKKFKGKLPKILYGGSVNPENIRNLKKITNLDGFLIGGASQNSKKFIDIVKKTII